MKLEDYRAFWDGEIKDGTLVFDLSRYELWKNRQYVRSVDCGLGSEKQRRVRLYYSPPKINMGTLIRKSLL